MMLENWLKVGKGYSIRWAGRAWHRLRLVPAWVWIPCGVILLLGTKPLLAFIGRPSHLSEITDECTSAAAFYCLPTVDRVGGRIAYWRNTEKGTGIFLHDVSTGKSQLMLEFKESTLEGGTIDDSTPDSRHSCLLPWSPDDRLFAFTRNVGVMEENVQKMLICHADTGKTERLSMAVIARNPEANSFFSWLTSDSFVYFDAEQKLHRVQKQATDQWNDTVHLALPQEQKAPSFIVALSTNEIVWRQGDALWRIDVTSSKAPEKFFEFNTKQLGVVTDISFSPVANQFLLSCQSPDAESVWALSASTAAPKTPILLKTDRSAHNAVRINGDKGIGYIYHKRRFEELILHSEDSVDSVRLFTRGDVKGIVPSANEKSLFVVGVASNEFAPGIWRYEVDAKSLTCVVPCLERPVYATKSETIDGELVLASGQKVKFALSMPPRFDRRQARRYPLVITGPYGSGYGPILANGGVINVSIARQNWDEAAVKKWPEDAWELYQYLADTPFVDKNRVFLGGASRETTLLCLLLKQHPDSWKGAIILNPGELPDLNVLSSGWHAPKLFISAGSEEGGAEKRLMQYQEAAAKVGIRVEVFIQKGAQHAFTSKASIQARMRHMWDFIFND